ncbi:MAG: hypothetical protein APR53_08685 [Methanoculleus sp. SDB]|nr:MAG: hypothetical protein APR53_08685 [Methanoculleus sp. SDB]
MTSPAPSSSLRNRFIGIGIIAASLLFFTWYGMNLTCGCTVGPGEGVLEGQVTIGPLCPVEPCSVPQETVEAAYAARKVTIYAPDGTTVVRTLSIDPEEGYLTALPPGRYVVDIARTGIDRSDDVPRDVTVRAGETVRVDIAIDTGIR